MASLLPGGKREAMRDGSRPRSWFEAVTRRRAWEAEGLVAVLELTNISKHFGAIQAVNDVSFVA